MAYDGVFGTFTHCMWRIRRTLVDAFGMDVLSQMSKGYEEGHWNEEKIRQVMATHQVMLVRGVEPYGGEMLLISSSLMLEIMFMETERGRQVGMIYFRGPHRIDMQLNY